MFRNREDAGKKLAWALDKYKDKGAIVLAIPRGGVEVGYRVANYLNSDFSIIITRKLPFPDNPEAGFGAIAEDGSTYIIERAARWIPQEMINLVKSEQIKEIARRKKKLRKNRPLPEITGRTVILVDDGIAMGSTMTASIISCRNRKAGRIIAAAPVSSPEVAQALENEANEVVILEMPKFFRAVAQSYQNWYDVPDREVIEILRKWEDREG